MLYILVVSPNLQLIGSRKIRELGISQRYFFEAKTRPQQATPGHIKPHQATQCCFLLLTTAHNYVQIANNRAKDLKAALRNILSFLCSLEKKIIEVILLASNYLQNVYQSCSTFKWLIILYFLFFYFYFYMKEIIVFTGSLLLLKLHCNFWCLVPLCGLVWPFRPRAKLKGPKRSFVVVLV